MRDTVIKQVNKIIGNDRLVRAFYEPIELEKGYRYYHHKSAARVGDKRYLTLACLMGIMTDGKPLIAQYDNKGELIGFK